MNENPNDEQNSEKSNKNQLSNETILNQFQFTSSNSEVNNFLVGWLPVAVWLGTALAAGVVGAIGASIWKRLVNEYDLKDLHNDVIKSFESILNQQFERLRFDEAMTYVEIAQVRMNDYVISPNEEDINKSLDSSHQGLIRLTKLQNYGGFGNFIIAAGIHLVILQEQAKKTPSKKKVMEKFVTIRCKQYLDDAEDYFIDDWIPGRFSSADVEVDKEEVIGSPHEPHDRLFSLEKPIQPFVRELLSVTYTSYYKFDGKKHQVNKRKVRHVDNSLERDLKSEAERAKDEHMEQIKKEFKEIIIKPAITTYNLWKKSYIFR